MFQEMQDYYGQQQNQQLEKIKVKQAKREEALNFIKQMEKENVST